MSGNTKTRNFIINLYHNLTKTQWKILLLISGNVTTVRQCLCKTQRIAQIYIDERRKMDNNKIISPGTANGVSGGTIRGASSDLGRPVPKLRRTDNVPSKRPTTKESTVLTTCNDIKINPETGDYQTYVKAHYPYQYQYNLLPYTNQNRFVNILNSPQRSLSDFAAQTQSLRNMSLFRGEEHAPGTSGFHQQHLKKKEANPQELRDKEIVRTLRQWQPIPSSCYEKPGLVFTLMSYNVLAQDLLTEHPYLYRKHNPRALLWEQRWKNLYEEIVAHNADIICLQEVQESHIQKYYSQLSRNGYASIFKKRTGHRPDGCAIYYRTSMFKCVDNFTVEYNQGYSVLDRDNVAIVAKLAPLKNLEAEFVVATTHLLYNPRRQDVRLSQTQVLLAEVDRMAYKSSHPDQYTPVIITGDFNSEPDSAIFKLVVNGKLRYENLANKSLMPTNESYGLNGKKLMPTNLRITDQCQHLNLLEPRSSESLLSRPEQEKLIHLRHSRRPAPSGEVPRNNETLFSTGVLSHNLNLQPVNLYHVGNDTEGTTNQDGWITVDYIFYSGDFNSSKQKCKDGKLKLVARYTIPTTAELVKLDTIPNFALGSDHLALLSKFKLEY